VLERPRGERLAQGFVVGTTTSDGVDLSSLEEVSSTSKAAAAAIAPVPVNVTRLDRREKGLLLARK
jgi:hypothetical protein